MVRVKFDPELISYKNLLKIFFEIHVPIFLNPDQEKFSQYRSVIFYHDEEQKEVATSLIQELSQQPGKEIRTEIVRFFAFYKAEDYHQDYYLKDPNKSYCQNVILPKMKKLKAQNFI